MWEGNIMPTKKSPEIDNLLTSMMGKSRQEAENRKECMTCSEPATEFRDDVSEREYQISGMCQDCQDKIFGV